ncbi:MAG: ribonuclease III [Acutalibacteraceae bacterium]
MKKVLNNLEKTIEYSFKDKSLLDLAMTHSSYANELGNQAACNERLEFLGDSVLSIIVSDYLYNHFETPEGDLTKLRASLVCEEALFDFAKEINLGDYIKLGKGESNNGGNKRPSILSDAFEALLAAMYLDGGIEPVKKLVLKFVKADLKDTNKIAFKDYKTELQEVIQKNPEEKIEYVLIDEQGPDHDKRFTVSIQLNTISIATGVGKSKKAAEQAAAHEALKLMGL